MLAASAAQGRAFRRQHRKAGVRPMGLTPTVQRRERAFTKPERKPKRSECLRGGGLMLAGSAAQGRVFRRQHRKAGVSPVGLTPTVQRRERAFTKPERKPKRSECLRGGGL